MAGNRRTPGISAFSHSAITSAQYASHGEQLRSSTGASLQAQYYKFQSEAQRISATHGKEIRSNPVFRTQFAKICNALGVDPAGASHSKKPGASGRVSSLLKGESGNEWYVEIAIRVVEVCQGTRAANGGIMALAEVTKRVEKGRLVGGSMEVSE